MIFNAELRAPVHARRWASSASSTPGTCSRSASDIDLGELRSAVGVGVRYKSPFGPIRFDLGFKVDRASPAKRLTAWFVSASDRRSDDAA